MQNQDFDIKKFIAGNSTSLKDYILLIRTNLKLFITIFIIILIAAIAYAVLAPPIYKSTVTLKIKYKKENVLQSSTSNSSLEELDRFIGNEIEVINNFNTRERVAKALIDTIESSKDKNIFKMLNLKEKEKGINGHKTINSIAVLLKSVVNTEQLPGIDVIEISAQSPSPEEAALIANTYADQYKELNLEESRDQLTTVRKFLEKQSRETLAKLNDAENALANFKEKGGIVSLDAQTSSLVSQLSLLDAQRDAAKIDLLASNETLSQYRKEIGSQDPHLINYLESQTSQAYIDALQKQITTLQMNRDVALSNKNPQFDVSEKIKEYDLKIDDLKEKLTSKIKEIKTGAFSSSPQQVKDLSQKMIEEEVRNHSLSIKLNELQALINNYEENLTTLPKKSMDYAGYERSRESLQQLYNVVEQKYQAAVIIELSQPGNVFIIGEGRVPDEPAKPSRILIILVGVITGVGVAFGFILIKNYTDDTVKSPYDIQKENFNLLAWIPRFEHKRKNGSKNNDVIILEEPQSIVSEAFKTLRARIQMIPTNGKKVKTILITSPGEGEGKTMVAANLAFSFAQLEKKILLIDGDLRKPRIHKIMNTDKVPGLTDILLKNNSLNEALRTSKLEHLRYLTSGTLITDTTKIFASKRLESFLNAAKSHFDFIIIDSAPIVAVIDSEILAKYVDGIILVVSADTTENKVMSDAVNLIKNINVPILGTVLNNFKNKSGYKYYYKYNYSYQASDKDISRKKRRIEI